MKKRFLIRMSAAGILAGAVNGILGAGGGMILVPLLSVWGLEENEIFPASVSVILPICVVSLLIHAQRNGLPWNCAMPYLIGSAAGGLIAGGLGGRIPVLWLHRGLGILILLGGIRYLC